MTTANYDLLIDACVDLAEAVEARIKPMGWTKAEDKYLIDNFPYLSDAELAADLGRSVASVHIRWDRDLNLVARSKRAGVITSHQAGKILGLDSHVMPDWIRNGFVPGWVMPGGEILLMYKYDLYRWALRIENWPYFDQSLVTDKKLRKFIEYKQARWGDEWWTTARAGKHHGRDSKTILHAIQLGRINGLHLKYSKGGRHPERKWSNWYVRRSEVEKMVFYSYSNTVAHIDRSYTPQARYWLNKAIDELGMTYAEVARTMKRSEKQVWYVYKKMKRSK